MAKRKIVSHLDTMKLTGSKKPLTKRNLMRLLKKQLKKERTKQ